MISTSELSEQPKAPESVYADGIRRLVAAFRSQVPTNGIRGVALFLFLLAIAVTFLYRPLDQKEGSDPAIYDYTAQAILRGQLPYRDVIDGKGPGASYLSALSMSIGRSIGISDVTAVRLTHVLLVGLLSTVTYLVAVAYTNSRAVGVISSLFLLMSTSFLIMMLGGAQPKLLMILFGMLSLLMIARDRPFWAGFFSMLSCLFWQPGLLFAGTALLIFSHYFTKWRDLRALKVIAGTLIPFLVLILYFYSKHALGDLWTWTVTFNYRVYAPEGKKPLGEALAHLSKITVRTFKKDVLLVLVGGIGYTIFGIRRLRARMSGVESHESFRFTEALLIPPVVYLIFCIINFQGPPDLIPFFPFVGIFVGWLLVQMPTWVASIKSLKGKQPVLSIAAWLPRIAVLVLLALTFYRALTYKLPQRSSLKEQESEVQTVSAELGPDDKIYVHGRVELLVLLNRPNLNPYILFDHGKDDYLAANRAGGFGSILEEMESQAPKVVSISRLVAVSHRKELREWVAQRYERLPLRRYDVRIRRE